MPDRSDDSAMSPRQANYWLTAADMPSGTEGQRVTANPMEAGYSGVHLWAQAVEEAGTTDTPAIRQALRNQRFDAPGGPVRVDSENQHT